MSISPASFQFIRGSILWSRPCFTPNTEEHNSRSVLPIWRGAEGKHPELILRHLAKWWASSKELSINRARRNFTRQPLNVTIRNYRETHVGRSPESWKQSLSMLNLQLIGGTEHQHIKRLEGRSREFFRMQTGTQACLLQTSLLKPADCAVSPAPQTSLEFCLGWQRGRALLC